MAQTKVFAPEGYHFMVQRDGGFYLQKNSSSGYEAHTLTNGDKSSEYVMMTYRTQHPAPKGIPTRRQTQGAQTTSRRTTRTTPTRTATTTRTTSTTTTTRTTGGSSSGGGYSGGY
jgi:hypothetical protein